jgi:hypothetical protein
MPLIRILTQTNNEIWPKSALTNMKILPLMSITTDIDSFMILALHNEECRELWKTRSQLKNNKIIYVANEKK